MADSDNRNQGEGALVMGSKGVTQKRTRKAPAAPKVEVPDNKAIVYSESNLNFGNGLKLEIGFNLVLKDQVEQVTKHRHVRTATVKEVKEYYGK